MNIRRITDKITFRHIIIIFILAAIGISLQTFLASHGQYTRYNNYVIFKSSFGHLVQNKNLYVYYPKENYDIFKYSPSFAFFMGVFNVIPTFAGLLLFNLFNTVVFILAVTRLKFSESSLKYLLLYVFLEACISMTNAQTNLLMAGLIILGFAFMEEGKPSAAALCIVLSVFIKLFGVVAFLLWLLYPKKIKFVLCSMMWFVIIVALPLIVISKNDLLNQYQSWWELLRADQDVSYGASLMGLLKSWFSINLSKGWMMVGGIILLLLPFLKYIYYKVYAFRLQMLASVLIWIVIFNHKAESPTYIIAMTGIAIWYFSQAPDITNTILLWLCLVFTSFTSTDLITPGWINNRYIEPLAIKAVFCSLIWFKLVRDLMKTKMVVLSNPQ
jgi:hypothetical protein